MQREYKCDLFEKQHPMCERGNVNSLLVSPPMITGDTSMTSIRRLLGLFATIALVAFAAPAVAQSKLFDFTVPTSLATSSTSQLITITFTNLGSSPPNSLEVDILDANSNNPNLRFDTTKAVTYTGYTGTPLLTGTRFQLTNLNPAPKKNGVVTIKLYVFVTGAGTCTGTTGYWNAFMWAGSPGSPSTSYAKLYPFDPATQPLSADPKTTNITTNCTISFVNQPADAFVNSSITSKPFNSAGQQLQVQLLVNGSAPSPAVTPTVSSACAASASATATDGSGVSTLALTSSASAQSGCYITASATGFGSVDSTHPPGFKIVDPTGILGCEDSNNKAGNPDIDPTGDIAYTGTADWSLIRASTPGCTPIPYTFNLDPANKKFSFVADKGNPAQPLLVEYIVLWNPETPTAADGYPTDYHLLLAWGFGVLPPANYFTPSVPCKQDVLAFSSLQTIPSVEPFITLSAGGLTQYTPGTTAAMCHAAHGWGAVGPLSAPQVQFADKVIDTDGFGSKP